MPAPTPHQQTVLSIEASLRWALQIRCELMQTTAKTAEAIQQSRELMKATDDLMTRG
jgi:hypothetical protein